MFKFLISANPDSINVMEPAQFAYSELVKPFELG